MTANEYQLLAARTINEDLFKAQKIYHAVLGMSSEVGEIAGLYQKVYQGHELDEKHVQKELGDLLWFIAEACTAYGWTMSDIMEMNIEKLKARYPSGFEEERSLKRAEGDV